MIDLEEQIRESLSAEASRARFDRSRWARSVTQLPVPRRLRFPSRRRVPGAVAGLAAAAVLVAAIAVPLAVLSRLGTGPRQVRPAGPTFERYGVRIDVPDEWDSRLFQSGDTRYVLLANFEIPPGVTGFSSELRDGLRPDQVTVFLQELTGTCPCPGFGPVELPISIRASDMTSFEGVPAGHAFARRTFVVSDRWFDLWVEFGAAPAPDTLLANVNDVLATLRIDPDSGWVSHQDQDDAVKISIPRGWTWREDPVPNLGEPRILFATGTWDFPVGGDCGPNPALEDLPSDGALVWLLEYRLPSNVDDFPPRPDPLSLSGRPVLAECSTGHPSYLLRFRDGFRYFQFHVAVGEGATDATRRDIVDVLNSMWPGPLPEDERLTRAVELCDRLVWVMCPLADWVRNTIWDAGFAVDGRTGSAIVGKAGGTSFYMWTTTNLGDPLEPAYVPLMKVDNVTVLSGGTQAVWEARGIRVWVKAGPTDEVLPSREQIEALVRASLTTPL
jgi:hypothetical protein